MQEEKPETALERALVDREETVSRLERELERERLQGKSKASTLQRRLEEALQQGQSATREQETTRMALAAAQMAHDQQMRDADKRQLSLRSELSSMQVHFGPDSARDSARVLVTFVSLYSSGFWRIRSRTAHINAP